MQELRPWSARNALNNLVAEPQSRRWVILKAQSFFQDSSEKSGVTGWLFFRVEFSEHRPQLRVALQDGLQLFVEQRFVDALRETCHTRLLSELANILQEER